MDTTPLVALRRMCDRLDPELAFRAETPQEWEAWREQLRAELARLLGLPLLDESPVPPDPEYDETEELHGYSRQRVTVRTAPDFRVPLYVLRPPGDGPFRPVVAFHGHGFGKRDVCGIAENDEERRWQEQINYAYAVEAVRRGYIVFAPDKRGFGELAEPEDVAAGKRSSCLWLSLAAALLGVTEVGLHVHDHRRLLDWIEARDDCLPGGVAAFGVSGGGQATLYLAALDERVRAAVVSGHLGSFRDSLLESYGCICNGTAGLLRIAEKGDIGGLIAPRPLLVETASEDGCYSRESQEASIAVVEQVYAVAGVPERFVVDRFDGRHEWSGRLAWDWLAKVHPPR